MSRRYRYEASQEELPEALDHIGDSAESGRPKSVEHKKWAKWGRLSTRVSSNGVHDARPVDSPGHIEKMKVQYSCTLQVPVVEPALLRPLQSTTTGIESCLVQCIELLRNKWKHGEQTRGFWIFWSGCVRPITLKELASWPGSAYNWCSCARVPHSAFCPALCTNTSAKGWSIWSQMVLWFCFISWYAEFRPEYLRVNIILKM